MKSLERKVEVLFLKKQVNTMLKKMELSKRKLGLFPKVKGRGYKYYINSTGHKMSLRQRYSFLVDLIKSSENELKKQVNKGESLWEQKENGFKPSNKQD